MNKPIIVGGKYRNKHTSKVSIVAQKIFFNIQHYYEEDPKHTHPQYTHHMTFKKNWELCKTNNTTIDEVI